MNTPKYNTFEEIERDLKIVHLERQIAKEEIINAGLEVKDFFTPNHLFIAALSAIKEYGIYYLIKKILK